MKKRLSQTLHNERLDDRNPDGLPFATSLYAIGVSIHEHS